MAKDITTKKHLLVKRARIMKFLTGEGYNNEEIGIIFNIERYQVFRILASAKKYKEFVKLELSDKKKKNGK